MAANHPGSSARAASLVPSVLDRLQPSEEAVLVATATLVGLGSGLGAVALRKLIVLVEAVLLVPASGTVLVALVPVLGGLLVGPIIHFYASEARGHGVPEIMEAVALRGGRIRKRVAVAKSIASAITIGTGGSAGAEGPIAQIGAGIGSTVGQAVHMSDERVRNLVACGAAGGIAATFNAPIAGVLFSLELILGEFGAGYFITVVISSVTASVVGRIFLGDHPAFSVPAYALAHPLELLAYVALGLLAAPAAVLFIKVLYALEDWFGSLRLPSYLKPALGGVLVGLSILVVPQVAGVGYPTIEAALDNRMPLAMLLGLFLAKIVVTSVTLGSGGSGGIFAPSLFMGAMLGGAFGIVVHGLWPQQTGPSGAYALVGMSALFAAAARAPLTSVIMLFEMSNDYRIILPLMLATVVATLASEKLSRESIYTLKLVRKGVRLVRGRDVDLLQGISVGEVMTHDLHVASVDWTLDQLGDAFRKTRHHGFPVVDAGGHLVGVVTVQDLAKAEEKPAPADARTGDIATRSPLVAFPDEPVAVALRRMSPRDIGRLPVVARDDPRRLLGVLRRQDVVRAYSQALARKGELERRAQKGRLQRLPDTELLELTVRPGSQADGVEVARLCLPRECVLTSIRRGQATLLPRGTTELRAGDRVLVLVRGEQAGAVREALGESRQE